MVTLSTYGSLWWALRPSRLIPGKELTVPTEREAGRSSQTVWTCWINSLIPAGK